MPVPSNSPSLGHGLDWMAAMRAGDYDSALGISDEALAKRDPATRDDPAKPYHLRWVWDGRPFDGRHVLVRCYHGLGDTIQFARYLAPLRARAASVTLEAQPELLPLLATAAGPDRLIAFDPAAPAKPAECDMEIMELAHALRLPPNAVRPRYLHAAPQSDANAIGLCWQAGGWDPERTIPDALLAPLLATGHDFVCLHPRPAPPGFRNPAGCPRALEHTAILLTGLRHIVTVDTAIAHLAGALGHPAWLLLKHDADWRWGHGPRTDWYPSFRLFRQPTPGDWPGVIAAVARALRPDLPTAPAHRPATSPPGSSIQARSRSAASDPAALPAPAPALP